MHTEQFLTEMQNPQCWFISRVNPFTPKAKRLKLLLGRAGREGLLWEAGALDLNSLSLIIFPHCLLIQTACKQRGFHLQNWSCRLTLFMAFLGETEAFFSHHITTERESLDKCYKAPEITYLFLFRCAATVTQSNFMTKLVHLDVSNHDITLKDVLKTFLLKKECLGYFKE